LNALYPGDARTSRPVTRLTSRAMPSCHACTMNPTAIAETHRTLAEDATVLTHGACTGCPECRDRDTCEANYDPDLAADCEIPGE